MTALGKELCKVPKFRSSWDQVEIFRELGSILESFFHAGFVVCFSLCSIMIRAVSTSIQQSTKKMNKDQSPKSRPITDRRRKRENDAVASDLKEEKNLEEAVSSESIPSASLIPAEISAHFKKTDPKLYEAMKKIDQSCTLFEESPPPTTDGAFQSLCRAIVYQQLSGNLKKHGRTHGL